MSFKLTQYKGTSLRRTLQMWDHREDVARREELVEILADC